MHARLVHVSLVRVSLPAPSSASSYAPAGVLGSHAVAVAAFRRKPPFRDPPESACPGFASYRGAGWSSALIGAWQGNARGGRRRSTLPAGITSQPFNPETDQSRHNPSIDVRNLLTLTDIVSRHGQAGGAASSLHVSPQGRTETESDGPQKG